jgi:hypothetical protein
MNSSRYLNVLLVIALMAGALAFAPATLVRAAGTTWIVDSTADAAEDGVCGVTAGDCTLRDALDLADASGDTIQFSVAGTITLTEGELVILKSVTIAGPGAGSLTISGGNVSRIFNIANGVVTVNISGLTIANGKADNDDGGGIYNIGTLLLDNVVVTNNNAVKNPNAFVDGGGIYSSKSLTITNSQITNNSANFMGGGIFASSTLNMTNVTVSGNDVAGVGGGGVGGAIAFVSAGTANLKDVTILSNTALAGGGLYLNNLTTANITDSLIASNTGSSAIGGVWISSGGGDTVTIKNSTISGNHQTDSGSSFGGGIWVDGGVGTTVSLQHVTVTQNTVEGTGGGAGIYVSNGTANVKNSIIAENTAANSTDADCSGTINSQNYNLIQDADGNCTITGTTTNNITGTAPLLNPLADNGGLTETHSLQNSSSALEAIPDGTNNCGATITTDQRGAGRPADGNNDSTAACDIGAYEGPENASVTITADAPDPALIGVPISVSATVAAVGNTPRGTVSITGANTNCNITLSGGSGSCNVVFNTAGVKTLTATYNGDLGHNSGATDTESHIATRTFTFKSDGAQDGWILENAENGNAGNTRDASATTLRIGDDVVRKQYRSILSFNTDPNLPDTAVITKVTLKVKQQAIVGGGNPVAMFQGFIVDIRKGTFGTSALLAGDWQAAAQKTLGPLTVAPVSGFYTFDLTSAKANINKVATNSGLTQIRLRFQLDDNNNGVANFLSLFSGNAGVGSRPQLIVEYYVP